MSRSVHEVLARSFIAEGTRLVFNVMGDGNKHWLVDLATSGTARLCNARHEGAALAMADGFARATSQVGVCSVTYGPGATQLPTSLMVASKHRTPLVVFAGDISHDERDSRSHLDFDARRLFEASGASVIELRDPGAAQQLVRRAFGRARSEGKPVILLAPIDVQEQVATASTPPPKQAIPDASESFAPADDHIAAACEILTRWRRPLVVAGRGTLLAGADRLASELAAHLGALTATTFLGKGIFDGEPFDLGLAGGFAFASRREIFHAADGVLAIGAQLNEHTTDRGRLFPDAELVVIDRERSETHRDLDRLRRHLQGDARLTISALLAELTSQTKPSANWRTDELRRQLAVDPRRCEIEASPQSSDDSLVDPRRLLLELDALLPDDAQIVVGGGHSMAFPMRYLSRARDRRFLPVFDFMTVGQALPSAIGAAMGATNRPIVGFEGDASFLMQVQELETAARYHVPLLFFVLNDQALGAEYHRLSESGLDPSEAVVPTPDLAELARAFGARGKTLASLDDLATILSWFEPSRGPHVVDCRISRQIRAPI